MKLATSFFAVLLAFVMFFNAPSAFAVDLAQVDDFEDGSTAGWSEGGSSPNPPVNVVTDGPDGVDDNFLRNVSDNSGAGGKMVMFNNAQWTGDYTAAGVMAILMDVRVSSNSSGPLSLRLAFQSGTSRYASVDDQVQVVPNDDTWYQIAFGVNESDLVQVEGALTYAQTMAAVDEARILHDAGSPSWRGEDIVATADFDNIAARAFQNYQGWVAESAIFFLAPSYLEEEKCFGPLNIVLLDNDEWFAGSEDQVCWGRNTSAFGRVYDNFDGANFPFTEAFDSRSTRPLQSAGGNLFEIYGEDVEAGIGTGEERFGSIMTEPDGGDLMMLGGYQVEDIGVAAGAGQFVHILASSTESIRNSRNVDVLQGLWRISYLNHGISRADVNRETALAEIASIDLQQGGVCAYQESTVFQDPAHDTNSELIFTTMFNVGGGTDLSDRGVQAGLIDRTNSNCTYTLDGDMNLAVTRDATTGQTTDTLTTHWVISDDNNYLALASNPNGVNENPTSLAVGYRAPSAADQFDLDGTYLFYLTLPEFEASGVGSSYANDGFQEFDAQGRGQMVFDPTTDGVTPAGQVGNWYACSTSMILSFIEYQVGGEPGPGFVFALTETLTEDVPFTGCDYNITADGSLLVNLSITADEGGPDDQLLLQGYISDNGEVLSLLSLQTEPEPFDPVLPEDFGGIIHIVGMKYSGVDSAANEDGDEFTNLEEFQLPLATPITQSVLLRRGLDNRWFNYELTGNQIEQLGKLEMTRSSDYSVVSRADFDGDGEPDLLVRDLVGGENGRWVLYTLRDMTITSQGFADLTRNSTWTVVATEDFSGDGAADVLVRNSADGRWLLYLMIGQTVFAQDIMPLSEDLTDSYVGGGDFNLDGRSDVLLRRADGSWLLYLMDGLNPPAETTPAITTNTNFVVQTLADFDANGTNDVLLRRNDGRWFMYLMNGDTVIDSDSPLMTENTDFTFQSSSDFDGNGAADVLVRRADGRWFMYTMNGLAVVNSGSVDMTENTDFQIVSTQDFNGDESADVLLRRNDGRWVLYEMDGPVILDQGIPDMTRNTDWVPYPAAD